MNPDLSQFYNIYGELEGIAVEAEAEASAAEAARAAVADASRSALRVINGGYDGEVGEARVRQQTAHDALESRLRVATELAGRKGSNPVGRAAGTGLPPDFEAAAVLDNRLAKMIEDKRRLGLELEKLQAKLLREGDQARAKAKDAVTFGIGVIGAALGALAGANAIGAIVIVAVALVMQYRLGTGPSAVVNRQALRRVETAVNQRMRSGVARVVSGWYVFGTVVWTWIMNSLLSPLMPGWNPRLPSQWVSDALDVSANLVADFSMALFLGTLIYSGFLLTDGYRRRSGY